MQATELRVILEKLALPQSDFARLIGVTTRAVSLWLSGHREVPGPVEAYISLFARLPIGTRQAELARTMERKKPMREGIYAISYNLPGDPAASGVATLIFEEGRIYGADAGAASYDGEYSLDDKIGRVVVRLKVTFPPNGMSIFGIAHPYEWAIEVRTEMDPALETAPMRVTTNLNQAVDANYKFVRPLPQAA